MANPFHSVSVKTPGIAGGAFLLLVGTAGAIILLGSGAGKIAAMFIGAVILYALLVNYQVIINQINGLGSAVR